MIQARSRDYTEATESPVSEVEFQTQCHCAMTVEDDKELQAAEKTAFVLVQRDKPGSISG